MIFKGTVKKTIAVLLILITLGNVIAPTVSYALTSGPTAPEATSFEPVDTTDLVNPLTGDMTYNIPLLEVPGPAGGYPLSLSYHAGIQPNEDASWVGLGWSLNPGAINRRVSGYADDHQNVMGAQRTFWEGGSTSTYSVGLSIGSAGASPVSVGMTISNDTYRGFGVGYHMTVGLQRQYGPLTYGANYTVGVSPYGQSFSSFGIHARAAIKGLDMAKLSVSATLDGNGNLVSTNVGIHNSNNQGISISSTGAVGISGGVGQGQASVHNSKQGQISTSGYDYAVSIPIGESGISLDLGTSYQRYWTDETETVATNGSLYLPTTKLDAAELYNKAYDSYDLYGSTDTDIDKSPDEILYGSFLDYDSYQVLAQGVSGAMRPYHYKSYIYRQNKKENNVDIVKCNPLGGNADKVNFRFIGDFSNRYTYSANSLNENNTFQSGEITGENENDGYDETLNTLFGSKSIDWYSNSQILSGSAKDNGFIDTHSLGLYRDSSEQIGGFKIKNQSGVTYHYSLPVYSYDEYTFSGYQDVKDKYYFNQYKRSTKYAYTWLLTSVTGPDYIDKNLNGYADSGDLGYWVDFNYGKWTDTYMWRNPAVGFNKDVDRRYNSFSKGKKEIYYLNSIKTETHTAWFVKEIRKDGKSVTSQVDEAAKTYIGFGTSVTIDNGGFAPVSRTVSEGCTFTKTFYARSQLKLSKIYLFKNEDINSINNIEQQDKQYDHYKTYTCSDGTRYDPIHYGSNVLDIFDIKNIESDLNGKSLRSIVLNTDYSLSPETDNSFVSEIDVLNTSGIPNYIRSGKLTLNSMKVFGKNGDFLPETKFNYDLTEPLMGGYISAKEEITANINHASYQVGDLLKATGTDSDGSEFTGWFLVTQLYGGSGYKLKTIGGFIPTQFEGSALFVKTKNPPYNQNFYDIWGMYKSDYGDLGSENISRRRNEISSQSVDVWSLRGIENPLGSKVLFNYESDQYEHTLKQLASATIKDVQLINGSDTEYKVVLFDAPQSYGIKTGSWLNLYLLFRRYGERDCDKCSPQLSCGGENLGGLYDWTDPYSQKVKGTVKEVGDNYIKIDLGADFQYNSWLRVKSGYSYNYSFYVYDSQQGYKASEPGTGTQFDFKDPSVFVGGEIYGLQLYSIYGGDLRTTSVSIVSEFWNSSTNYSYSGGKTSYEPIGYNDLAISKLPGTSNSCALQHEESAITAFTDGFQKMIYGKFLEIFKNARELPGPCVLYSNIFVSESQDIDHITYPTHTEYEYQNYDDNLVSISRTGGGNSYSADIYDFSSQAGILKRVTLFDANNVKVSETKYTYLHDGISTDGFKQLLADKFKNQGLIEETFADSRYIKKDGTTDPVLSSVFSKRHTFPALQIKQETTTFKTGITTSVENSGFDFYSGEVTSTLSTDGFGNTYKNVKIPAYRIYESMGIGHGKANMLTQEAANYTYKVNGTTKVGLVSATAQTWSDGVNVLGLGAQSGIWRMKSSYSFVGTNEQTSDDGLYPYTSSIEFSNWNETSDQDGWQKNTEITLYDTYSHALEASDVNGNSAATVMNLNQSRVAATAANCKYVEIGYSGAEDQTSYGQFDLGGNVRLSGVNSASVNHEIAHTGSSSLLAQAGQQAFLFSKEPDDAYKPVTTTTYHVSVWSSNPDAAIKFQKNGTSRAADYGKRGNAGQWGTNNSNTWYLIEADILNIKSTDDLKVWCEGVSGTTYFDDFRIHPFNSSMTSYVYNSWGELSHILNSNNLFTNYKYDDMGRLTQTYQETFQGQYGNNGVAKVSETSYNYGKPYMVTLTGSKTGPTGMIQPGGDVSVKAGSSFTFQLINTCSNQMLQSVTVDGFEIIVGAPKTTLLDGTEVIASLGAVNFTNVTSSHSVVAQYETPSDRRWAACSMDPVTHCYDGMINICYLDECGEVVVESSVSHVYDLPAALQQDLPAGGCPASPPDCGQLIKQ